MNGKLDFAPSNVTWQNRRSRWHDVFVRLADNEAFSIDPLKRWSSSSTLGGSALQLVWNYGNSGLSVYCCPFGHQCAVNIGRVSSGGHYFLGARIHNRLEAVLYPMSTRSPKPRAPDTKLHLGVPEVSRCRLEVVL